jgi:Cdc6-like AAA superfamily ATPase
MSFTQIDIERWIPQRWDQILGNEELVEHYQDNLRNMLSGNRKGLNTMVFGPSRSGKTAVTKLFARCLLCENLDYTTLNPCSGTCDNCQADVSRFGLDGLETILRDGRVHYLPIDCTSISASELRDKLVDLRDYEGIRVVYLDEVHRLQRNFLDEQLLKPVEERNFMWIVSSAAIDGLEQMFKNRFTRIRTSQPTEDQLALWLGARCVEWGISWDDSTTLLRLAERSRVLPGLALQALARAAVRPGRVLTRKLVERHIFDSDM